MLAQMFEKAQLLSIMRNRLRQAEQDSRQLENMLYGVAHIVEEPNTNAWLELDGFDNMEYQRGENYEHNVRLKRLRDADDHL